MNNLAPLALGFALGLALVAAPLLSAEARAVIVGILLGMLLCLPTIVTLLALVRRERARLPRVTVVDPGCALEDRGQR